MQLLTCKIREISGYGVHTKQTTDSMKSDKILQDLLGKQDKSAIAKKATPVKHTPKSPYGH